MKGIVLAVICMMVLIAGCVATHEYTKQDDEVLFGGRFHGTVGSPFKFKIVETQSTASATPQFKQVMIKTSITNVSNAAVALHLGVEWVFRLINEKGAKYAPTTLTGNFAKELINPGQTVFGIITFDVPHGTYVLLKVNLFDRILGQTVQSFQLPLNPI